jgi:hypothetical protein
VLTGAATETEAALLAADEAYGATRVVGNDAYRQELERLIADPALRRERGMQARLTLAAADDAWDAAVDAAFAQARALGPIQPGELGPLPAPDDRDVLIDWCTSFRGKSSAALESNVAVRELIAAHPGLRPLYGPLEHRAFRQIARFPAVFATPPADAATLRAIVAQFRILSRLGVAERYVIALPPETADVAVPVLEAALAEGPDFDLELTLAADPIAAAPAGSLALQAA